MCFLFYLLLVFASELEIELFHNGNISKALEMDITEPIDYALKYFLLKQFKNNLEEATCTALSAPEDNELILLLTARTNPQNSKLNLPQQVRTPILQQIAEAISVSFYENKYEFRELVDLSALESRAESQYVLKNIRSGDAILILKFFYFIDTRVYLLKDVIPELEYLAKLKNRGAYCFLGHAYLTGTGVEKDTDKAFEYFWAATDSNRSAAYLGLGKILLQDEYKNVSAAINAFKLADSYSQNPEATYCLHLLTEKMRNFNLMDSKLLKKSAISGYLPAVQEYTKLYIEQGLNDNAIFSLMSITQYSPFFIKYDAIAFTAFLQKDYKKACLIYLFLAEFDLPTAVSNSIYLMENYTMFENQNSILFKLYKVLSLTNVSFNKKLGDCYFYGKGVEKSLESAFHSYLSSNNYSSDGSYCTAYMYEEGLGVPKNLYEAKRIILKYINKESLYLVRFYAVLRINIKILLTHYRLPVMISCTAICLSTWWVVHHFLRIKK